MYKRLFLFLGLVFLNPLALAFEDLFPNNPRRNEISASAVQPVSGSAEAWQEVERILNAQYTETERDKQLQDLIQALKKWAELYNDEKKSFWEQANQWGFFPGATSIAQVDLTAMIMNLKQNKFFIQKASLLEKAAKEAGLWYEGFPAPPQTSPEPKVPRNPRERP